MNLANRTTGKSSIDWKETICRANGIDVNYIRTGGDKPSLVALHGLIGSGRCLSPLARKLQDHFDVVLPDARGHGGSSAPAEGYSYADLANDVICLTKELRLKSPVLLGHSMGGLTAAVAGGQLGRNVRAIVLVDPTFISPEWQREVFESDIAVEHRQLLASTKQDLITQAIGRNPSRSAEMIEFLAEARLNTSPDAFKVLTPPNPDYRILIRNVRVPILLLIGERGVVSLDAALELQRINPLLNYEMINGAGHGVPYDQPEQLGAAILSFLSLLKS